MASFDASALLVSPFTARSAYAALWLVEEGISRFEIARGLRLGFERKQPARWVLLCC